MNDYQFLKTICKDIKTIKQLIIAAKIANTSILKFMITISFFYLNMKTLQH